MENGLNVIMQTLFSSTSVVVSRGASREVLQRMNLLRVYLNDMNTEEAMNELLKRLRGTKSNEEFLASMNS